MDRVFHAVIVDFYAVILDQSSTEKGEKRLCDFLTQRFLSTRIRMTAQSHKPVETSVGRVEQDTLNAGLHKWLDKSKSSFRWAHNTSLQGLQSPGGTYLYYCSWLIVVLCIVIVFVATGGLEWT